MNAKDIIHLNNEKREELNEENLKIYEDMLVYIRLNSNKSEQQTEEVLLELLNHLLEAQSEGKSAKQVFGEDIREYCDDIIEEIPTEKKSDTALFLTYIILDFLAIISFVHGALGYALYHFFDLGSDTFSFSLGTGVANILAALAILYISIKVIFKWLKRGTFTKKPRNNWVEFFQLWIFSMVQIGLFIVIFLLMPEFGTTISIPILSFAILGALLYLVAFILNRKYRITK